MRKAFTLFELIIVIVIMTVLLTLGYSSYTKWQKKIKVESATKRVYSEIEYQRMRAFSQKLRLKVVASDKELIVINLDDPSDKKVIKLGVPFSGTVKIDEKGLLSSSSIVYEGDLNLHPSVSCVVTNGVRVRMGKTYVDSRGRRKCR
ncbi:prepilin-type N-terminal cleavage/methylation domain-containing protein [Thermovibrio guaymasensis]|uniref:Prepilin-type N-terminal cleavage/methylation domain-containing protein n=1 Tax=Thermovibrio guaymasensis TaxID=240167 RepID=A0A420W9Q9_9BACT|nr:prepilin-type N-terminal cleavage/methylation domain-containing protein [Thermovibrio guaymasensis]RKQ64015.1 prepilin-type N-terminal cleavage/methylation domain-containing protein [Thermovibrio guaymasensis]